ncbi:hypothetical protein BgiBS90_002435 [Biomphalaria glabrata]|nr:hypothetical protein BgiBS90_002435 [Biomphalaria glabrata]
MAIHLDTMRQQGPYNGLSGAHSSVSPGQTGDHQLYYSRMKETMTLVDSSWNELIMFAEMDKMRSKMTIPEESSSQYDFPST